jgi:hypothetical protein
MSILTNIIAAETHEIEAIGESLHPVEEWTGIEMRNLDTAKITTLHCLLTGELFDEAIIHYEPIYASPNEGALVLRIANEAKERLAELDEEQFELVAIELAATEEFEDAAWGEDEITAMLAELCELARRAESEEQELFVWMHPLRT